MADCSGRCLLECTNLTTAHEEAATLAEQVALQEEELLDLYVDQCERSCRVQIYGYNISREEVRTKWYYY